LEGTIKGHLVQPLCTEQGHLQLDQVAQSPVTVDIFLSQFHFWLKNKLFFCSLL